MKASRQRLFILTLLFIVTAINYMDRANLAVAGSNIQNDFSLTPTQLGLLFSMFTWAYAASQIPVGYVLDRIGSRILYGGAIILWRADSTPKCNAKPPILALQTPQTVA